MSAIRDPRGAAPAAPAAAEPQHAPIPAWHFPMLNDEARNSSYERALRSAVRPGDLVLDIGAGSGLLAMIAADCGAGQVLSCETVPALARTARRIVGTNGLDRTVAVVAKSSTELLVGTDLPRRADVVVTETVDFGLLGEGILPALRHARQHLARPGAVLVPARARIVAVPVESSPLHGLNHVSTARGYDVRAFNDFAEPGYLEARLHQHEHRHLAAPQIVAAFDFTRDPLTAGHHEVPFTAETAGTCHGIAFWFELDLDDTTTLTNSPERPDSHWPQAFFGFAEPRTTRRGEHLAVDISWDDSAVSFQCR